MTFDTTGYGTSIFNGIPFSWIYGGPHVARRNGVMVLSGPVVVQSSAAFVALSDARRPLSVRVAGNPMTGGTVYADHFGPDPSAVLNVQGVGFTAILSKFEQSRVPQIETRMGDAEFTLLSAAGLPDAPPALPANVKRRQVVVSVKYGSPFSPDTPVTNLLGFRIQHGVTIPFAKAQIVTSEVIGDYNNLFLIYVGTIPGNGLALRFAGYRRNPRYDMYPRGVSHDCIGVLGRAAETYLQHDLVDVYGGLLPQNLVTAGDPGMDSRGLCTADAIIAATLNYCLVPFDRANIGSTGRYYGNLGHWKSFVWKSGGPDAETLIQNPFSFSRAGESGLDYIHRYNQIEAEMSSDGLSGGFYRTIESLGGSVFTVRIGGRPRADVDVDPAFGEQMIFEEGKNILTDSASFERQYPIGNRTLVVGMDTGLGYPHHFEVAGSNPFMDSGERHYDPNPPSGDMIEWSTKAQADAFGFGMDAETVANARQLEVNRETPTGSLRTAEDWLIGPVQTHLVQGPAGLADRLGTGEKLWVQANEQQFELTSDGAPVYTQTPSYIGGGWPDEEPSLPHGPLWT